jgi:putative sigma-54 modulation protein
MRIEIRGRNTQINDAIREHVAERLEKVSKQVNGEAQLEVELLEERNPAIANGKVAEATLHLKGTTLRAKESSADMRHSIDLCAEKLARQVKRYNDKRRPRRDQPGLGRLAQST